MKLSQKAFTIVELLVVIAIIGILAAIVLTSLNDARVEGIDAKVLSEMDAINKRAQIEQNQFFTYDVVCGTNGVTQSSVIADIITSINTLASSTVTCNSDTGEYALSVGLNVDYWCVDSSGARKTIPAALTTDPDPDLAQKACP